MNNLDKIKEELYLRGAGLPLTADQSYRAALPTSFKGQHALRDVQRAAMFLRAFLVNDEEAGRFCALRNITSYTDETGGVFVIPEIEKVALDLRTQYGVFRRNANTKPMLSEEKTIHISRGGLRARARGFKKFGTSQRAKFDSLSLTARPWSVLVKCESNLLEDSETFLDELIKEMAHAFTLAEDDAGFNGDGSDELNHVTGVIPKLRSIADDPADIPGLKVASGASWGAIVRADVLDLISRLPAFARRGAVKWYCSHEFWAKVLLPMELASGNVSYVEEDGETKPLFIGKPVEFVEVMPTETANDQIPLLYGNLAQAAIFGDRRGVAIKRTDSPGFSMDIESIRAVARFDVAVHSVGDAEQAGAIVGLATARS